MKRYLVLALFLLAALSGSIAKAQVYASPQVMLLAYYNAINLRDYPLAYGLWISTSQPYENFVNGYAETERVEPYFGAFQPSTTPGSGRLPAVLLGYHTDGVVVSYYGCFTVSQASAGWRIADSEFRLISYQFVPDASTIEQFLGINCYDIVNNVDAHFKIVAMDKGQAAMTAYYQAINRRDYGAAYSMWLQPLPGPKPNNAPAQDYRLPYDRFVAGYADTIYVNAYFGDYIETGASMGHTYLDGVLPAVLVGQHTDGSVVSFYGCYVLGKLTPNGLGIVSGKFLPLIDGDAPTGQAVLQALKIDCFSLGLST
jgi:hypothetical protein